MITKDACNVHGFVFRSQMQEVGEAWNATPRIPAPMHKQPTKFLNEVCLDCVARPLRSGRAACRSFCRGKNVASPLRAKKVQRKQRDIKQPRTEIQKARRIAGLKIYGESDRVGQPAASSITCSGLKRRALFRRERSAVFVFRSKSANVFRQYFSHLLQHTNGNRVE